MTTGSKVLLIACGSFNPITPMHLRMFEIARDQIYLDGEGDVVGGILSPVHDEYKKQDLAVAHHRLAMAKLALQGSNWIRLSDWETQQKGWTRTRVVLQQHQNMLNSFLKEKKNNNFVPAWLPDSIRSHSHIQVRLLCGADVVESFSIPGLWKEDDIETILSQHGIVVITRASSHIEKVIFESDILSKYRKNVKVVTNWAVNEISSTLCRRMIRRGLSVKYLLDDYVTEYIMRNNLYQSTRKYVLTPNHNSPMLISPLNDEGLDNYVLTRNTCNSRTTLDDGDDSMDETDRAPQSTKVTEDDTTTSGREHRALSRTYVNRPGGAVKVSRGETIVRRTQSTPSKVGALLDRTVSSSLDAQDTEKEISTYEELNSDDSSNTVSVSNNSRKSPAKDYNEMIKFVFTEHGIRVISDKEYVV